VKDGPAFQLYASDFYMDTTGWTPTQVGVYIRLLLAEWVNGPLPNQMSELARIAGLSDTRTMYKMWSAKLVNKFVENGGGLLINKRLEEVRAKQRKYRESQKEKGKRGADIRWEKVIAPAMPVQSPDNNPSSSSSSSITKNKYYKDERQNFVCLKCLKSWSKYDNFKTHDCEANL